MSAIFSPRRLRTGKTPGSWSFGALQGRFGRFRAMLAVRRKRWTRAWRHFLEDYADH